MAVNSVNNNTAALLNIIKTMSKVAEAVQQSAATPSSPTPGAESNPLQNLFQNDGYDAGGAGGAGGAGDLASQLQALTDTMSQITDLLNGGETGEPGVPELGAGNGAPPAGGPQAPVSKQAAPPAPAANAQTPAPGAEGAKTAEAQKASGNNPTGGKGNTMDFTNDGDKPMTIKFTPNAGGQEIPPLTLQPGESGRAEFPQGWAGNFRSDKGDPQAVTLGEVKFNGGANGDQTFYDVSYIEGNNAAMTMAPESGGKTSGTLDNIANGAPDSILAKGANGETVGIKKTTNAEAIDNSIVDYYRGKVGAGEGYVVPKDDLSTLGTSDTHLEVHLKDVF